MSDDNDAVILIRILMLMLFIPVMYFFGMESGEDKGKTQGIVLCMEQPQKCKISYDYLKLQENQK
jgi:hypothetical protein